MAEGPHVVPCLIPTQPGDVLSLHRDVDIAVVGAGAAGLAAGIFAAETRPGLTIVLLDGARTIGAKILVSGGGRCNVTHVRVTPADFHAPPRVVSRILQRFDEQATIRWFESLGVPLKQEPNGKLFPASNKARTVLQALLGRSEQLGVRVMTPCRVQDVRPTDGGFQIMHEAGAMTARRVIMATGGQSLPKSGSDGYGWSIAQRLGHTVTATYPALVPLVLDDTFFHRGLSGISHEATVLTRAAAKPSIVGRAACSGHTLGSAGRWCWMPVDFGSWPMGKDWTRNSLSPVRQSNRLKKSIVGCHA